MTLASKGQGSDDFGTGSKGLKVILTNRGLTIKQTIPIKNITMATAIGSELKLFIEKKELSLSIGASRADIFATKINTSNRTLVQKLGVNACNKILFVGPSENAEKLEDVLVHAARTVSEASSVLTVISSLEVLDEMISIYDLLGTHLPIWIIYGRDRTLKEADVFHRMSDLLFLRRRTFRINDTLSAALFKKRVQNLNAPRFSSK